MDFIENRTFDEIAVGDTASLSRTLTRADIELFAVMSGDVNPAHLDEEYARSDMFHKIIAHGMWGGALISTLLGTHLPGPGAIYLSQTLRFRRPVVLGDTVTVSVKAIAKDIEKHRITFACICVNQRGEEVISGSAEVIAPIEKVKRPRVALPEVHLHDHGVRFRQVIGAAAGKGCLRVAVVNPVDRGMLAGVVAATQAGVIVPVLVGPEEGIRACAAAAQIDVMPFEVVPAEFCAAAVVRACALVRAGSVDALIVGCADLEAVIRVVGAAEGGLSVGRCLSHVFVLDVVTYPRPLLLSDAVVNAYPDVAAKRDIVQNAIDLARAMGVSLPRVAVLSASETVDPQIRSSLDAAALCKMADRGQIVGGMVEGPLSFDGAVSAMAAQSQGLAGAVAGQADVLIVPDLEAGSMLVRQLEYLAEAQSVGLVLGARVPIVSVDRATTAEACVAACAAALLLVRSQRGGHD